MKVQVIVIEVPINLLVFLSEILFKQFYKTYFIIFRVPVRRPNQHQLNVLLKYMEKHSLFARRQITKLGSQGNKLYHDMWLQLVLELNKLGPQKIVQSWMKVIF